MDAPDLARIRYVTRHYVGLQGLWLVPAGVPCFALLALAPYLDTDRGGRILQMLGFWTVVAFFQQWSTYRVRDYYATRIGKVIDDDYFERSLPWLALFAVALLADILRFHTGGYSSVFFVIAVLALWRSARGWPWRAHQLALAVVATGAFIALRLPGPAGNAYRFIVLGSLLIYGTAIICALLDHRLLVRTLRPQGRVPGEDVDAMEQAAALDEAGR